MLWLDQRVSTNYHKIKIFLFNLLSAVLRQTDDIIIKQTFPNCSFWQKGNNRLLIVLSVSGSVILHVNALDGT